MDYEDNLDASILQAIMNVEHYYRDPYTVDTIIRIALGKEHFHLSLALDGAARKNRESTLKNFRQKNKFNFKRCIIRNFQKKHNIKNRIVHFEEPEERERQREQCPLIKSFCNLMKLNVN